eukprot:7385192-Prymnesium_polylepis.1
MVCVCGWVGGGGGHTEGELEVDQPAGQRLSDVLKRQLDRQQQRRVRDEQGDHQVPKDARPRKGQDRLEREAPDDAGAARARPVRRATPAPEAYPAPHQSRGAARGALETAASFALSPGVLREHLEQERLATQHGLVLAQHAALGHAELADMFLRAQRRCAGCGE